MLALGSIWKSLYDYIDTNLWVAFIANKKSSLFYFIYLIVCYQH